MRKCLASPLQGVCLTSALALAACAPSELPEVTNAVPVSPRCTGEAENRYFAPDEFRALPIKESDRPREMGRVLQAMHEPALSCGEQPDTYRILWVHSFASWGSAMVRMSRRKDFWVMTAVQFGDSLKRDEILRRERTLSDDETRDMLRAVNEFGLWRRQDFAWSRDVLDGGSWMVEGRRGPTYHPVLLVNKDDAEVRKIAFTFWKAAGIKTNLTGE